MGFEAAAAAAPAVPAVPAAPAAPAAAFGFVGLMVGASVAADILRRSGCATRSGAPATFTDLAAEDEPGDRGGDAVDCAARGERGEREERGDEAPWPCDDLVLFFFFFVGAGTAMTVPGSSDSRGSDFPAEIGELAVDSRRSEFVDLDGLMAVRDPDAATSGPLGEMGEVGSVLWP